MRSNLFGFTITGPPNVPIVLEACTDLKTPVWTPLFAGTVTNFFFYFSDGAWTNYPNRFYHIRQP